MSLLLDDRGFLAPVAAQGLKDSQARKGGSFAAQYPRAQGYCLDVVMGGQALKFSLCETTFRAYKQTQRRLSLLKNLGKGRSLAPFRRE